MEERERLTPLVPEFPQDLIAPLSLFLPLVNRDLTIIDFASGKGDVLAELKARGHKCFGIEPNQENCKESKEKGFAVACDSCIHLSKLDLPRDVGAVWIGRAFEKIEIEVIENILRLTHLILPDNAPLFFSIPLKRDNIPGVSTPYTKESVKQFLEMQGFNILNDWDETGPNGVPWWSVIAISKGHASKKSIKH